MTGSNLFSVPHLERSEAFSIEFVVPGEPKANKAMEWDYRAKKPRTKDCVILARKKIAKAFRYTHPNHKPWPWPNPVWMKVVAVYGATSERWIGGPCTNRQVPDLDNLQKLTGDALNGVAYEDDSQIECILLHKRYGKRPHLRCEIMFLDKPMKPRHGRIKVSDGYYVWLNMGQPYAQAERVSKKDGGGYRLIDNEGLTHRVKTVSEADKEARLYYDGWIHP